MAAHNLLIGRGPDTIDPHTGNDRSRPTRSIGGRALAALLATPYRPTRVVVLLMALAVMSAFDLLLTLTYLTESGMMESNPIARVIMVGGGTTGVVAWKGLTVLLTCFILFIARRKASGEIGAIICCAVLGWLMVRWETYTSEAPLITSVINHGFRPEAHGWVSMPGGAEIHTDRTPLSRIVLRSEPWDQPPPP